MTKWIDCLKEYNRNKRVWCTPRKGTRSYAKVMQCVSGDKNAFVKKKKFKVVEKFEDEKARDIQDNPDIVVQMKRATINDVPDAVMNNIMGQFLDVKDKANLASVGVKVKMTDEEEEEAKEKSYNYNKYMEVIDYVRELVKNYTKLVNMRKKYKSVERKLYNLDFILESKGFTKFKLVLIDDYIKKLKDLIYKKFISGFKLKGKIEPIFEDGKFYIKKTDKKNVEKFYTNNEIYNLMNLPNLTLTTQKKNIGSFWLNYNRYMSNVANGMRVKYIDYLNLLKSIDNDFLATNKLDKLFRYAVIYYAVKKGYVKSGIKLFYDVDTINKKIFNLDNVNLNNIEWDKLIRNKTLWDTKVVLLKSEKDDIFSWVNVISKNPNLIETRKFHYFLANYPQIFNFTHKTDPFNETIIKKMEQDVKKIRQNFKDDDNNDIKNYKKYIDDGEYFFTLPN